LKQAKSSNYIRQRKWFVW